MRQSCSQCAPILVFLFMVSFITLIPIDKATPQEEITVPDYFIKIDDNTKKLNEKIALAEKKFKKEYKEKKYWYSYQFELRPDIKFKEIYIHDNGDITISRRGSGWIQLQEEDDLEVHVLHALSELGDDKAKEEFEKRRNEYFTFQKMAAGLFIQVDIEDRRVEKIKLLNLNRTKRLKRYPVFWFGNINNEESFNHLTTIIEDNGYSLRVKRPALFVLSLHEHPQVIPYLTKMALGNQSFEIRTSSVFWLGQIPKEQSFHALDKIFNKEKNSKMKEKIVFAMSQHNSDKVLDKLADIARNDADFEVRAKAIFWLGQIDKEESLKILKDILKITERIRLKEKVVFSISQHKSQNAVSILIDIAENHKNREIRKKAIFWLGQMAGKKTLEALGGIVESGDETEVKTKAVFAISQHDDKELAAEMLMDIAKHNQNPEVRKKAIFWLGQMGDERSIEFFKEILMK